MERNADPARIVRALAQTAERIEAVSRRLSAAQLVAPPAAGAWSPNQILWHVRATADVHGGHIARIIEEDQPRWRHVSPRARMKKTNYNQLPFAESFGAFAEQRAELVARLGVLPPEAWQRHALVTVPHRAGAIWHPTPLVIAWGMVDHEEVHCAEMEALANSLT